MDKENDRGAGGQIEVHPLTSDPTQAWNKYLSKTQIVKELEPREIVSEVNENNRVRFVCMSDTHSVVHRMTHQIPPGDVYIHAGDFTKFGSTREVKEFNDFLASLPHRYKIVIAGNHELSFDPSHAAPVYTPPNAFFQGHCRQLHDNAVKKYENDKCHYGTHILTEAIYLEDEAYEVYGIKIYGTPWQPEFGNWAFNLPRGQECLDKWNAIPDDTQVLITHSPPIGHGDLAFSGLRAGCIELLETVQKRVKPKYHVFGHIHEGYGITTDGTTVFINASTCNVNYKPVNPPIIFDIQLPAGQTKQC